VISTRSRNFSSGTRLRNKAQARVAFQDFFAFWKDADTDIPVLIAAKTEYAKLQ